MKSQHCWRLMPFLILANVLLQTSAVAQDVRPMYAVVNFIKVDRNKSGQYEELIKNYGAKVWADRIARGEITSFTLYSVGMRSGDPEEYNYVTVASGNNIGNLMEPAVAPKDAMRKAMPGATEEMLDEVIAKYGEVRVLKNSALIRYVDGIIPAGSERKFFQIRYQKTQPGKVADYLKVQKDLSKPVVQSRITNGDVTMWTFWEVLYPSTSSFNYVTATGFTSWDKVMSSNFATNYQKVFPKGDVAKMEAQYRDARTITQEEVWKQVFRVDNTTK